MTRLAGLLLPLMVWVLPGSQTWQAGCSAAPSAASLLRYDDVPSFELTWSYACLWLKVTFAASGCRLRHTLFKLKRSRPAVPGSRTRAADHVAQGPCPLGSATQGVAPRPRRTRLESCGIGVRNTARRRLQVEIPKT